MKEIASIILFLTVAIFSSIIYEHASAVEIDKQTLAEEQLSRLNQLYKGVDAFCDSKNYHADLVIECKAAKSSMRSEFRSRMDLMVAKRLDDGAAKVKLDAIEQKCLADARARAEALNVQYELSLIHI